ncbi:hypothetical protein LINPERHAP1_LOCUS38994 [Linum perenne]
MCGILSLLAGGDMEKEEGLRVLEGVRKAEDVRECRNMIKFVMDNNTWVNGKRGTRLEKNKKNDVVVRRCGAPFSVKLWDGTGRANHISLKNVSLWTHFLDIPLHLRSAKLVTQGFPPTNSGTPSRWAFSLTLLMLKMRTVPVPEVLPSLLQPVSNL